MLTCSTRALPGHVRETASCRSAQAQTRPWLQRTDQSASIKPVLDADVDEQLQDIVSVTIEKHPKTATDYGDSLIGNCEGRGDRFQSHGLYRSLCGS